jgi:ADP-dependent NAD(P)H-hydrate dehydratase
MSPCEAFCLPDQPWPLPRLAPRQADAHKGSFGTALIVGGSRGMTGAAALAGMAALRGGAGLVRVAVPDVCLDTVAGHDPAYMTIGLRADRVGRISLDARGQILRAAESATVVGLGPGLGRSLGLDTLVAWLFRTLSLPTVVDADALNALSARPDALSQPVGPRILTPHPGEFARLVGKKLSPEDRNAAAAELARRSSAVVVLKGHRTCTTDGQRTAINTTGNPGMASGGSGDVLTGLIVALACQGLEPFDAARLGVYLHGLAGDLAAAELGQLGTTATDLVRFLPQAIRACFGA